MAGEESVRLGFHVQWYDREAELLRPFILFCHPDNTVELIDSKRRRIFLRRTTCPTVTSDSVVLGGTVNVFNRQMEVLRYADVQTRRLREKVAQRTFAILKPDVWEKVGEILEIVQENGFTITKLKSVTITQVQAEKLYEEHKGKHFLPAMLTYVTSGPLVALELVGDCAVARWLHLIGPKDPDAARRESPCSLRAKYGRDSTVNSLHGASTVEQVLREMAMFFPGEGAHAHKDTVYPASTATLTKEVTCCVIRPHAVSEKGTLGRIITAIYQNRFKITAIEMFKLNRPDTTEFLEVYGTVVPYFEEMVDELSSGPCVVLEVGGFGDETQERFRGLCGPWDSEMGKLLRPKTLRARFGTTKLKNSIHCTDLQEDARLECEYFFCLLKRV